MTGRRPLGANVGGVAAVWVLRRVEPDIAASVRHFRSIGRDDVARELVATFADLREAARQWQESEGATGAGSPEVPPGEGGAVSGVPAVAVGCGTAARALNVSGRRVRQLLAAGALTGTKRDDGTWAIDPTDLARVAADRRTA